MLELERPLRVREDAKHSDHLVSISVRGHMRGPLIVPIFRICPEVRSVNVLPEPQDRRQLSELGHSIGESLRHLSDCCHH